MLHSTHHILYLCEVRTGRNRKHTTPPHAGTSIQLWMILSSFFFLIRTTQLSIILLFRIQIHTYISIFMFDSIRTISYYKTLISFYNNQQISNHNEPLFPTNFTNPSIFCFQRLLPIIITFLLFHFLTHRKIARTMTVIFPPRLCLFCCFFFYNPCSKFSTVCWDFQRGNVSR